MKFLMDCDGLEAVNTNFVKSIALISVTRNKDDDADYIDDEVDDEHPNHKKITVDAELAGEDYSITLKEFDSGEYEKDFQDAKAYLAELIKSLNNGIYK